MSYGKYTINYGKGIGFPKAFCFPRKDLRKYNLCQFAMEPIMHPRMVPATTPAATSPAEEWSTYTLGE